MSLSAFLKANKKENQSVMYVASKSFVDENGNPLEWELKQISCKREESIKSMCSLKVKNRTDFDTDKYTLMLAAATVISPNLNAKELQDSYGVMGSEALLLEMLSPGELTKLKMKAQEVNGYGQTMEELREEVKN